MANKNISAVDDILKNTPRREKKPAAETPDAPAAREPRATGRGSLLGRQNAVARMAEGRQRDIVHELVAPKRVRLWSEHNRRYDLLSAERCADLIDGFKRTGKQEFPCIVRRIHDDADHDYELICGARRHWTAGYLGWDLLVEVRDLDDRQAFTLQDLENRDREDISDYERALDYQQALPKYFDGKSKAMAEFLEIDHGNFHRLLDLAKLPSSVVTAYADIRDLKVHHGTAYKKLQADSAAWKRVTERARYLKGKQLPGPKLFSELKRAAHPSAPAAAPDVYRLTPKGQPVVRVTRNRQGRVTLTIEPVPEADRKPLRALVEKALTEHGMGKL